MSTEPTREDILKQMHETLASTEKPQYMNEIAMPTVYRPVDKKDAESSN